MAITRLSGKTFKKHKGKVYDLTVKNTHTYNVDSIAVHNSAAGSLAAYCLQITHVDPIQYGLLFERFLNPARVSAPDVDCDIDELRRHEVVAYVQQKYGHDKVAHIGTYGCMKAKAAIRDVTRTLGLPYSLGDKIAKLTLDPIAGKPQPLKACYEKVPQLFNMRYKEDGDARRILEWAEKIEDRMRAFSTHAAGIVVSKDKLSKKIPLYPGKDNAPTTQFEMYTVEDLGLIKFDFLGLRALTTIDRCVKSVSRRYGIDIDPLKIPVDDEETYKTLQAGDVIGLFQIEGSQGIRDLVVQIKPRNLEDIATILSIYRPGPLGSPALQHYLKVRAGEASPKYLVPELEPILSSTDGFLIFQEQILEICKQLAGYSLAEADIMRRVIGKKKEKEMEIQHLKFVAGMKENGFSQKIAEDLFAEIESFAAYGFNKSVDKDTLIDTVKGPKKIKDFCGGEEIISIDQKGKATINKVKELHDHGKVPMWELKFDDGTIERCTLDHKWLTKYGQQPVWRVLQEDLRILQDKKESEKRDLLNNDQKVSLWARIKNLSCKCKVAQRKLCKVSRGQKKDKTGDQSKKQSIFSYAQNCIRHCKENFCQARNMQATSKSTRKVEKRESRKVCRDSSKGSLFSKVFKNGSVLRAIVKKIWICTQHTNQLRDNKKTSGLCESKNGMGFGSGWTLAFSTGEWRKETCDCTTAGFDLRKRTCSSKLDIGKTQHGELQVLWRAYRNRINSDFRDIPSQTKRNLQDREIVQIKYLGIKQAYDLEVEHESHNFVLSSGLCTSNSHAISYGYITYQMAWLKTHYPLEFMCACLVSDSNEVDKVIQYISACKERGIDVLGPSVNESEYDFDIGSDGKSITFGLSAVKNLGKPVQLIIEERKLNGPFKDILDFAARVDLTKINKRKLESLVLAGAFDGLGDTNRMALMGAVEEILKYREELKKYSSKLETFKKKSEAYSVRQSEISQWMLMTKQEQSAARKEGKKKPGKMKLPEKPQEPQKPFVPVVEEMTPQERLSWEKELLGYFISGHPLDIIRESSEMTIGRIKELADEGYIDNKYKTRIVAIPSTIKTITTKKDKKKMAYIVLEDKTGTIQGTVLPPAYKKFEVLLDPKMPALYEVELEITEGDTHNIPKVMIHKVYMLPSVKEFNERPLDIIVSLDKVNEVVELIQQCPGKDTNIDLYVKSEHGNVWSIGKFKCEGERSTLQKLLGEL